MHTEVFPATGQAAIPALEVLTDGTPLAVDAVAHDLIVGADILSTTLTAEVLLAVVATDLRASALETKGFGSSVRTFRF